MRAHGRHSEEAIKMATETDVVDRDTQAVASTDGWTDGRTDSGNYVVQHTYLRTLKCHPITESSDNAFNKQ